MQDELRKWILSMEHENGFRFSKDSCVSLLSTCFGILALNQINYEFSFEEKKKFIDKIMSYHTESGLFIDPTLLNNYDFSSSNKDEEYLLHQMTDFSIYALFVLEYDSKLDLKFLDKYKDKSYIIDWLDNLNWYDPWLVSNNVMFILNFLIYQKENLNDQKSSKIIDEIMFWLDENQDSNTGFWGMDKCKDNLVGLAGAFHIIIFYYYLKKKLNYEESMVDATISLQKEDGLFGFGLGGGACEDLDAVDVLIKISLSKNYKRKDIKDSLVKVHKNLIESNKNLDGGFCYNKLKESDWKYSGFDNMKTKGNESDMWSAWFRPLAIALIENLYPDLNDLDNIWKFRRHSGLGWHNFSTNSTE